MESGNQQDLFSTEQETKNIADKCVGPEWSKYLKDEFGKSYMKKLSSFLKKERKNYTVRPNAADVFKSFKLLDPEDVKVVMVGQDPYPHKAADGLAFSSRTGAIPPSLSRLYDEIEKDTGTATRSPKLDHWATQGTLLLNKALTVRQSEPKSHHGVGWEEFIEAVLDVLCYKVPGNKAFMFFGKDAQRLSYKVTTGNHLVIEASHPARNESYAMNLKDKGYFKRIDDFIQQEFNEVINW